MSQTKYAWGAAGLLAALLTGAQLTPATALADPEVPPQPQPQLEAQPDQQLHNVTYRARIDGVSRNATITYKIDDAQINTADPTMLPGRTFETTGVVTDPQQAGMAVRIDWPYSANLHCEVLVDDQIVAQADTFVAPRLFRPRDDPGYGILPCGASVNNTALGGAVAPADGGAVPPADAGPPPAPPAVPVA
ncbi:hypothetical protein ACWDTP_08055 [Mycobacterium sp. NPDC003449]